MGKSPVCPILATGGGIKWTKLFTRHVTGSVGGGIEDAVRNQYAVILVEVTGTATVDRSGYTGDSLSFGTGADNAGAPTISLKNGQRTIPRTTFIFQKGDIATDFYDGDALIHYWNFADFRAKYPEGIEISKYIVASLTQTAYGGRLEL